MYNRDASVKQKTMIGTKDKLQNWYVFTKFNQRKLLIFLVLMQKYTIWKNWPTNMICKHNKSQNCKALTKILIKENG